ncbi:SDR family oxidoreductase [Herbiconiux sp. CPCC 203407]|uniref:SDR family oxidoreductase n=1 Tax=Herbiconiux oxytropis TaxID=2970915 RepID=A0AA41XHY0_9MICO|nr:SDR family oxidoreductase [Herbiconiux oxytropis]MCS5724137.1 SDR family oxidoreductase [Herbiconiux oxytropis]MCS5726928.1 SDR family oxidoreductase [Herbiconiux oxytropis]
MSTIAVTGAAQGIGEAVANRLAAEGLDLVLVDRQAERLGEVADRLRSTGVEVATRVADLSVAAEVHDLTASLTHVDGLVNVAGIGLMSTFEELELSQWERTFAINVTATFILCQGVGAAMAARGAGRIVNMASIAGKRGSATLADYCASKAAVISLTQSVAAALGPNGVTVNAVCPGLVWTPMWEATGSWVAANTPALAEAGASNHDAFLATVKASTPLQKPTRVEDIAAAVNFLLSDDASLITGQAVNVDGGIEVH